MAQIAKDNDKDYMRLAFDYANRMRGATKANPSVGCLIVKNDSIIACAHTDYGGRPHAEVRALAQAGINAKDATVYVSLEPCCTSDENKTSCADALIKAGIKKIFYAAADPNPNINGKSYQIMKKSGVETIANFDVSRAEKQYAPFFFRMRHNRSLIILKIAISKDGKIAKKGQKNQLTNDYSNKLTHLIRAYCDAIMIGSGTLLIDNPQLTCRLKGLEDFSPDRYVIDAKLKLKKEALLIKTVKKSPINIFVEKNKWHDCKKQYLKNFDKNDIDNIKFIPIEKNEKSQQLSLCQIIEKINADKINLLMLEAGQNIASSMLKAGLIDEVHLIRTPHILGKNALEPINFGKIDELLEKDFVKTQNRPLYGDNYEIYLPRNSKRRESCLPV